MARKALLTQHYLHKALDYIDDHTASSLFGATRVGIAPGPETGALPSRLSISMMSFKDILEISISSFLSCSVVLQSCHGGKYGCKSGVT